VRLFYKCNFNRLAEKWLVLLALGWIAESGITCRGVNKSIGC